MLTPTMIIMTLQDAALGRTDLSSFRQLLYGSSPMAAEWIKKALDAFGDVEIIQAYGLTETSPILTILPMAEHEQAMAGENAALLQSVGRPIPGVEMRIVDDHDTDVPIDAAGEIIVRGANVSKGYLNRPDETRTGFRKGWLHTGDIGRMNDQGYLFLLDRKKDMIITGGENVYSSEVEACLYQHPGVHECAVVGVPDDTYGEALLAVVVATPGAVLTDTILIAHCRDRIGGYKIPRRYRFVDELPKSAMNKILKNELRRMVSTGDCAGPEA
jgi:long-chain acyl-CoA synthetase